MNAYIQEIAGEEFTAKDFRTWAGTVLAAMALQELQSFDSQAQARKNIVRAVESVAEKLGNTKAVCRKCYILPALLDSYLDGGRATLKMASLPDTGEPPDATCERLASGSFVEVGFVWRGEDAASGASGF